VSETVHNRIAMLRVERGISRRQLADALGVHYQTVGYLERGEFAPSLYLALRLARHFEVPVEVIFSTDPFPRLGSTARIPADYAEVPPRARATDAGPTPGALG
jgi:DNA-binding XRE family transcriptional regulator